MGKIPTISKTPQPAPYMFGTMSTVLSEPTSLLPQKKVPIKLGEPFHPRIRLLTNNHFQTSVDQWYRVPKRVGFTYQHDVNEKIAEARKLLTIVPKVNTSFGPKKTKKKKNTNNILVELDDNEGPAKLYREDNDNFYVPRFYGATKWGKAGTDNTSIGEPINVTFNGKLLSKSSKVPLPQQETVDTVMNTYLDLNKTNGALISVPCGFGKTVMALAIIAKLKVRAYFLCPTESLLEQAIERCKLFLPDAKIGIVRQDKCEIEGKDVIFGTIQSLYKRDYSKDLLNTIGLVIVDECHHASSFTFSRAILKLKARYILGLSATPRRKDGLEHVFHWLLGPLLVKIDRNFEHVDILFHKYVDGDQKEYKRGKEVNFDKMRKVLANDGTRNHKIISRICQVHFNSLSTPTKRKAVGFSHLVDHVQDLKIGLLAAYKVILEKNIALGGEKYEIRKPFKNVDQIWSVEDNPELKFSVGLYVGEMHLSEGKKYKLKKADRAAAAECDVILATYQMMEEGVDIPRMDKAYFLTPKGDIEQALGRILRAHSDKNIPSAEYFFDPFSVHLSQGLKALEYLKALGYVISWD